MDDQLKKNIIETKKKDFIIQKFVLDNSIINIMIIDSFNLNIKKRIGKLKRILHENYKEIPGIKYLYIIHNNLKIKSDNEYNEYIKNNFPKNNYYNKDNIIFSEKLDIEKFEIIHFVPKSYKNEDEVIKKIYEHITTRLPITLIDFDQMIYNSFTNLNLIFDGKDYEIQIINNYIKCNLQSIELSLVMNSQVNFNFDITWSDLKIYIPSYNYYIDKENNLILCFELPGFKKVSLKYKPSKESYKFNLKAEKEKEDNQDIKMIYDDRCYKNIDFYFKIPFNIFTFSSNEYEEYKYHNGIITFKYKPLNNSI
jgi:HSP20 family molecular chaperone IbpA